jgi:hypothetical protein
VRAKSVPGPEGMSNFSPAMSKQCRTFGRHGHISTWAAVENDVENCMKMSNFVEKNPALCHALVVVMLIYDSGP